MARLGGLVLRYVDERRKLGQFAQTTAKENRIVLWRFAEYIGVDQRPTKITARKIERWLLDHPRGPGTLRNEYSKIRVFCRWLLIRGHMRVDPFLQLTAPKIPRQVPRGLPDDDLNYLVATAVATDRRMAVILLLMAQEGLRCVEVCNLEMGDIDFDRRVVIVTGKGSHERELPLSDQTMKAVRLYVGEQMRAGPLVRSKTTPHVGVRPNYLSTLVGNFMREHNVKGTAHRIRHSMARDMLENGADIREVRDALGHSNISTTDIYIGRTKPSALRSAMQGRQYGYHPQP
jgi:integrase/recombinase XerC